MMACELDLSPLAAEISRQALHPVGHDHVDTGEAGGSVTDSEGVDDHDGTSDDA